MLDSDGDGDDYTDKAIFDKGITQIIISNSEIDVESNRYKFLIGYIALCKSTGLNLEFSSYDSLLELTALITEHFKFMNNEVFLIKG